MVRKESKYDENLMTQFMRGPFIVLHLVKCEAFVEGQERHITYYNAEPPIVNQIVSKTKGFV